MRFSALLFSLCLLGQVVAQVPQAFDFQGVARDASGNVLSVQPVSVRLSLHSASATGPLVYQEVHAITTNSFGLFSLAVGQGSVVQGTFGSVAWGTAAHFLQVELDASGGSNYLDMGTTQLLSVPYALHAGSVDCPTVSLLGDTLKQANGCFLIIPGLSAVNGGCADADNDGFYNNPSCPPLDCNDTNAGVYPGAIELCGDDVDNDCDGTADNNSDVQAHITWYADADADGFGTSSSTTVSCAQPLGYVDIDGDCDDADPGRFPGQGCSVVCSTAEQAWIDQNMEAYLDIVFNAWVNCFGNDASCVLAQLEELELTGEVPLSQECHSCAIAYVDCVVSTCLAQCIGDPNGIACTTCLATSCRPAFLACAGLVDADGDGSSAGSDCNDGDDSIYPGAQEICDGVDNDCDGLIDDLDPQVVGEFIFHRDADGDGFGDENVTTSRCVNVAPPGYIEHTGFLFDCNDEEPDVYPGAPELCDPWDNDCDGIINEEDAIGQLTWYADNDADGFGDADNFVLACDQQFGTVDNSLDCDDTDPAIYPGATENCTDGIDNDCDAIVDEIDQTWYEDLDGDGYGNTSTALTTCEPPSGYVLAGGDCNDDDPEVRPNAFESCGNGIDDDCDGFADENCVPELCDGIDNDNDGLIDADDPGLMLPFCEDQDGVCSGTTKSPDACVSGTWLTCSTSDYLIGSPVFEATEASCDGLDNDCDGLVDEDNVCDPCAGPDICTINGECYAIGQSDPNSYCRVCDPFVSTTSWTPRAFGTVCSTGSDCTFESFCDGLGECSELVFKPAGTACDDGNPNTINDVCDGLGNCSGAPCPDQDGDGYSICQGDCDDNNLTINPGAAEVCADGIDNNCDGVVDEGCPGTECGFFNGTQQGSCDVGSLCVNGYCVPCMDEDADGFTTCDGDCDDSDPSVYPSAPEICGNGIDNNCDGGVDEGCD